MTSIQLTAKASLLRGRFNDVMATRRAYAASFGTGAALVACAALLFVVASTIVAFNGLPGDGSALAPVAVSASPSHGPVSSPAATRLAAFAAAAPASGGVGTPGRGARRGAVVGHGGATTSGSGGSLAARPVSGPTRAVANVPITPVPAGGVVAPVTTTVGQTVSTVLRSTGFTVAGVGQTVGSTVTKVTGGVAGGMGAGAGRVVGGVGAGAGSAVGGAGRGAGGVVSGAGQTVGGLPGN